MLRLGQERAFGAEEAPEDPPSARFARARGDRRRPEQLL